MVEWKVLMKAQYIADKMAALMVAMMDPKLECSMVDKKAPKWETRREDPKAQRWAKQKVLYWAAWTVSLSVAKKELKTVSNTVVLRET